MAAARAANFSFIQVTLQQNMPQEFEKKEVRLQRTIESPSGAPGGPEEGLRKGPPRGPAQGGP
ncbi:hypothetical protein ACSSS7_001029 [Eimeria intestinalis]